MNFRRSSPENLRREAVDGVIDALEREARAAEWYQSVVEGISRDLGGRERAVRSDGS